MPRCTAALQNQAKKNTPQNPILSLPSCGTPVQILANSRDAGPTSQRVFSQAPKPMTMVDRTRAAMPEAISL